MIPRLRPAIGLQEIGAALTAPHTVDDFERAFAMLMDQAHAVAFPYGRTGLLILLRALGLKNREIILPSYTCVVVAHAIVLSGNKPVFIDSEANGFNMDLDLAEAAITPRTGAILATSIHGYPVDLDRLAQLSHRHPDVAIIQDCAHSFSAEWKGRPVQKAGVAAVFGLNISKLMTSIFGGMITTDNDQLANALRLERNRTVSQMNSRGLMRSVYLIASTLALNPSIFGLVKRIADAGWLNRFVKYYDETLIDMPGDHLHGMSKSEASVGVMQVSRYPTIIDKRRKIATYYHDALSDIFPTQRPPILDGATYSHYVLQVENPQKLVRLALSRGVELGRLIDYCIPDMPVYRDYLPASPAFSRTRQLNASVVNLPIWVDRKGADRVVSVLSDIARL